MTENDIPKKEEKQSSQEQSTLSKLREHIFALEKQNAILKEELEKERRFTEELLNRLTNRPG